MPKVTASFFNVLIWRSVRAILICFMAPVAYTPDIPPVNPLRHTLRLPQDESGVPLAQGAAAQRAAGERVWARKAVPQNAQ
jgi:hypothetical protein